MTTVEFTGTAAGSFSSSHKPALYQHQPITMLFSRPPADSKCLGYGSGLLDCPLAKNSSSIQA